MSTACKTGIGLALLLLALGARGDTFTNYSLYGWSSPSFPSDQPAALRGSVISMPAYFTTNNANGWVTVFSNAVVGVSSNYHSNYPISTWPEDEYYIYVPSNDVAASFRMNTKDRRAYELSLALFERASFVPGFRFGAATGQECDDLAAWYYRYDRQNLVTIKEAFAKLCDSYADVTAATNALLPEALPFSPDGVSMGDGAPYAGRFLVPPYESGFGDLIPRWTPERLCSAAGGPSNWVDYTPWRQLDGNGSNGIGHISVEAFTISTPEAGVQTNHVLSALGDDLVITGTNGQVVTLVVTNAQIEPGYTHFDYGYRRSERYISLLAWPIVAFNALGETNSDHEWGGADVHTQYTDDRLDEFKVVDQCDDNISQALDNWFDDYGLTAYSYECVTRIDAEINMVGDAYAVASGSRSVGRRTSIAEQTTPECSYGATNVVPPMYREHGPTNVIWELYAWAIPFPDADYVTDIWIWDAFGTPFVTSNLVVAAMTEVMLDSPGMGHQFMGVTNATLPYFDELNATDWPPCLDFTPRWSESLGYCVQSVTNEYARGFMTSFLNAEMLARPGWRFGATIDVPGINPAGWSTTSTTTTTTTSTDSTSSSTSTDTSTTSSSSTTCGPPA